MIWRTSIQFILSSLEWPFCELFSANISLWNKYKYIAFNIFSCRISVKIGIFNEKTNELITYGILCRNVTIFYYQELASLFQVQNKLNACQNSKFNFLSSCFTANDNHITIVWLHVAVSGECDILNFWDNVNFLKYYPVKLPQNCFNFFNSSNQTCIQVFVNSQNGTVM